MRCKQCGEETGLLHECSKLTPADQAAQHEGPPPRLRFAPLHYLKQAIAIARFNDKAILRNSRDNNAFLYGVPLWLIVNVPAASVLISQQGFAFPLSAVILIFVLPIIFVFQVAIWGICHLAAKFVLGGKGNLAAIARVMLLGSIVTSLAIIPVFGSIIAGLWGLAILMLAFENIHGIPRMHAFAITLVVGIVIRGIGLF